MADLKISQLNAFTETDVVSVDVLPLADLSAQETKKISASDLVKAGARLSDSPITFGDDVVVTGDLSVNGTTTTINTQDLLVEDKNIIIGNVTTPSDVTADGGGITLKGTTDKTINWVDATDAWTFSEHVDLAAAKELRIGGTKVIDSTSLGSGVTGSSLTSVGTIGTGLWQGTTIATGYGGTGQTTYTDGQLLIGKTDGTLAKAAITQGSGVTITNGDGSITISATGSGGTVTSVTATSPLASTGGTTPDISIQAASTTQSGAVQLNDTTTSTSTTEAATANVVRNLADSLVLVSDVADAALPKAGGTVSGNLIVSGDLTVNGTTTTIDTTTLVVEDKNIEIGVVGTPTDVTADGGGITLKGTTDKTINWVDATDAWTFSEHVDLAAAKEVRIGGTKIIDSTSLGSGVVSSSLTSVGTIGTGVWQGTTVATAYGGSGQTTYTDGQLLIGKTDGTLAKATLTAGSGVTVTNADGGITISATGSGGTITAVTATSPLASTGGTTPDISIQAASTTQAGAVQLNDTTTSTSTTQAATANVVKNLADSLVLVSDVADAALPKTGGTMTGDITFSGTQTFPGTGSGTVTSIDVSGGTGLTSSGGPITSSGTITVNLDNTAVTPGSYTYASITVDQQGRLTAASNGTTPLTSSDIGVTVQGYDADTAKYDDTTANFTGTLQNGGSNVVVDSDIGVTVQGYDADTAKLDVAQTFTAAQTIASDLTLNAQSDLRFADADSSNWVALQAPATIASNVTWTLPDADGSADQVLKTNGAGVLGWGTPGGAVFNEFTSSGTWTKPSGATAVLVEVWGGGGGGGSGARQATTTSRSGGGGGAGGARVQQLFAASALTSTVTVTVGAGGAGGAAVTTNSQNGNNGTAGGESSFGSYLNTGTAGAGDKGTSFGGGSGDVSFRADLGGTVFVSASDGANGNTGGASSASNTLNGGAGGGGGAGRIGNATSSTSGGTGGINLTLAATSTKAPSGTNATADEGGGGGGGDYVTAVTGEAGGDGAFPGGGGGGGSASDNGYASGKGGDGAAGVVRVWSW